MGERGNGVQDLYDIESQRVLPSAASPSPPAEEFRNTPPETGVGGDIFSPPEPTLNLVPFRCAKVSVFTVLPTILAKTSVTKIGASNDSTMCTADGALHPPWGGLSQHRL